MDRAELQKIIAVIINTARNKPDLAAEIIADIIVSGIDYNEIADYLVMYQPSEIGVQQLIFEKIEGWKFSLDKCMGGEYVNDTTEAEFDAWLEQPDRAANHKKDAWHQAVLHECMMTETCYVENDPLQSVKNLIDWHVANERVGQQPDSAAVETVAYQRFRNGKWVFCEKARAEEILEFNLQSAQGDVRPLYLQPPTKPQCITEQNATDVYISAVEHFKYTNSVHPTAWLHMQGRTLLAKLNENREPDCKAQRDELLALIIPALDFVRCGIGGNYGGTPYNEKMDEVYFPLKAAIAKYEGGNNAPKI